MATGIAAAQRGFALSDALPDAPARPRRGRGRTRRAAAGTLDGPFLSPGSLTEAERLRLVDGVERVVDGLYTHLPLKRARYGVDPVQRLRILRTQAAALADDEFHAQLASVLTGLRDAHTRYAGPAALSGKVAALPFLVEMIGATETPTYVVTKVAAGLDPDFAPGVVLEHWNGVPIDRAVQRHGDQEVGGRPDSLRAWAVQSLTLRSLRYGPPPDEHWVVLSYRTAQGEAKEIRLDWRIIDPDDVAPAPAPSGRRSKALRRTLAVDPASEAVRRAKMLLFAPHALVGEQASPGADDGAQVVETRLTQTLKAMSIDAPGGPYGYLRIYAFDARPQEFLDELLRLLPLLPDNGLIIDVRANPGGYIWAAETALQLFTPNPIQPTRFSALATPFTRQMSAVGALADDLGPWRASLDGAVRNGEPYGQTLPITDPAACNEIGQRYGGPVVLVADSTTYSSGDLFSAGFVDNGIGPFLCVGSATGGGGANVWNYAELRTALAGSDAALPALPDGIGLSFAYRRATRSGPGEGLPIEDVGIAGTPYAMTRDDLLAGNRDLIATCVAALKDQPFSRLVATVRRGDRAVEVSTTGLDRVDLLLDGHPGESRAATDTDPLTFGTPAGARTAELVGFAGDEVRQRRRLTLRR